MKVILLGPPGAGKGTQAALIAEKLELPKVSSGDLFRLHQERNTELGRLAGRYMKKGVLVSDEVTINMIKEWIQENDAGDSFLLDGFPRTIAQVGALDDALEGNGGIDVAVCVKVPEAELVRRLSGRLVCRNCQTQYHSEFAPPREPGGCDKCGGELYQRDDDKPEAVRKRFQVYLEQTAPVVEHYRLAGKLKEVSGEGSVEQVGDAIVAALS